MPYAGRRLRAIRDRQRMLFPSTLTFEHAKTALVVSAMLALIARITGALSRSGAYAAVAVGSVTIAVDGRWGALLAAYFVLSVAFSRLRAADKWERIRSVVSKGGPRDASQVLANGGLFTIGVLLTAFTAGRVANTCAMAAIGALAASAADTWATEIGTLARGT